LRDNRRRERVGRVSKRHGVEKESGERLRAGLALALLIAAALASVPPTIDRIQLVVASRPAPGDDLSAYDRRLKPVRDWLRVPRIGYLPRSALRADPGAVASDLGFLSTRFALAPTLVLPQPRGPLVFTDLAAETDPRATIPPNFEVEHDFGDGLLLLRPKAR
jgi:hypothetical protein